MIGALNKTSLVYGSNQGEIHFTKTNSLVYDKDFHIENIPKSKMYLGKTYVAHASFVQNMAIMEIKENDILLTIGVYDESIFKWKLIVEDEAPVDFEEESPVDFISKSDF